MDAADRLLLKAKKNAIIGKMVSHAMQEAADNYDEAASLLKGAKKWERAADAFAKAAECHAKGNAPRLAARCMADSARCYINTKTHRKEAIAAMRAAGEFFEGQNDMFSAKYKEGMADMLAHEPDAQPEAAIEAYTEAAALYRSADSPSCALTCMIEAGNLKAGLEDYAGAITCLEDASRSMVEDRALKFGVKALLLRAGLCHLISGDGAQGWAALAKYRDMDVSFQRTRECTLLSKLVHAVLESNCEAFNSAVLDYDSSTVVLSKLDVKLVLLAKQQMMAEAASLC